MFKRLTLTTAIILTGATAMTASAETSDMDRNEVITKAEFQSAAKAKFNAADTNKDGMLNEQERANLNERKYSKRKAAKRESQRARLLLEFDSNQDGRLSADEENLYVASFQTKAGDAMDATSKRKRRKNARIDTNLDGQVSQAEYMKLTDILFGITDADNNGVISRNEGNPLGSWLRAG